MTFARPARKKATMSINRAKQPPPAGIRAVHRAVCRHAGQVALRARPAASRGDVSGCPPKRYLAADFAGAHGKRAAILVLFATLSGVAYGAEQGSSKAACDALLGAEIKRLEDGFSRTRAAWEESVEQRFAQHTELTPAQMRNARETFNRAVLELSAEHLKAVALPGMYRMMLTVPQYDLGVCERPDDMRALGDEAIAGSLLKLTALLPLVETSVTAAKSRP